MTYEPTESQIQQTMNSIGCDYMQARYHLQGAERVRQINAEKRRQAVEAAVTAWIDAKPAQPLTNREKVLLGAVETALTVFQRLASNQLQGPGVPVVYARVMAAALEEAGL